MRIHFISIGGSVMHDLAISMKTAGHRVTGSDDEIYEPSKSRLKSAGLLPDKIGWDPTRINSQIEAIVLGMHARKDNPELDKALSLKLPVFSYPEFIYSLSKNKMRVVIAGSHGKTTTTGIVMRALNSAGRDFDYLVGARIEGFDRTVKLSDAPLIILEGDEYLSSAIDDSPKIWHYHPDIAVLTGIAWDHINVFPEFDSYIRAFSTFVGSVEADGVIFYFDGDRHLRQIMAETENPVSKVAYRAFERNRESQILTESGIYETQLFGKHNDQNLKAACMVCSRLGLAEEQFFNALREFQGADKRLQVLRGKGPVYLDFAHAPSKVKATVSAIKEKYPQKKLMVFLELHTFSSLNETFLPFYESSLDPAERAVIFCNEHTFKQKKMEKIPAEYIKECFKHECLEVIYQAEKLEERLVEAREASDYVILIMSSGNLGGLDIKKTFFSE